MRTLIKRIRNIDPDYLPVVAFILAITIIAITTIISTLIQGLW